ncbi:MAG: glycosyltransferase family 39 protein [Actinobacteria bacterium]|nr:glycosyltransferase family 39 protein [Actinomycetota bacterium]
MRASSGQSSARPWLVALVAIALAIRVAFLVGDPHPYELAGLSGGNGNMAHQIVAHGRWFEEDTGAWARAVQRATTERRQLADPADVRVPAGTLPRLRPEVLEMPGEALLLAGLWRVTGDERYVYVQVLQAIADSLLVLVVFWLVLRLYRRRRAALVAAGVYTTFLPLAWMAHVPNTDLWAADFTLLTTAALVKALDAERPLRWRLAAGLCVGAGLYFRPTVMLVPLVFALCAIPFAGRRRALLSGLVPFGVALLLMAPWTIRNAVEFHQAIPTRIGVGQALWEGMGELSNGYGAVLNDGVTARQVHALRPDLEYGTPAYDRYLQDKAVRLIRAHPLFYAKVMARRAVFSTVALRNFEWAGAAEAPFAYADRTGRSVLTWPFAEPWDALRVVLASIWEPLLLLAGLATALVTRRRWWRRHLLLLAVPLATTLPYLFLHLEARYLLPASFVWMSLAALGADLALERVAVRRRAPQPALVG